MSLRQKTLVLTITILLVTITLLYVSTQTILLQSFRQLETENVQHNLERVLNTIHDELANLNAVTGDWAHWDDTYQFVQDGNQAYINSNLFDQATASLGLNLMVFADQTGEIVYHKALNLETGEEVPLSQPLYDNLSSDNLLLQRTEADTSVTGIIMVEDTPMMIASEVILTSQMDGPSRGSLVFGRFLDSNYVEFISTSLRVSFTIYAHDSAALPDDVRMANQYLSTPDDTYVQPLDEHVVAGYGQVIDIYGAPAFTLRVEAPRDIYQQGMRSVSYFFAALFIIGVVFGIVSAVFLERAILSRVSKLSSTVSTIRSSQDLSLQVDASGGDELANLANGFNEMVSALAQSRRELQRAHDALEIRVQERTRQLSDANTQLRQEIAERVQAQEALALARDQALDTLRLKTQILANVSHDARTPLNVITLRTEVLLWERLGALTPKQRDMLQSILASARQLLAFMNNLLDEAQIEANKMKLKYSDFSLMDMIHEITSTMTPLAEKKGLWLHSEIAADVPATLVGDPERIKQVLANLVGNAIKFTEKGGIVISVTKPDESHWAIHVSDTGQGIPAEAQEHIFTPFWQVDGSITRETNRGIGLGLSIVKELTTLMRGDINVQSELGRGSTFTVILPLVVQQEVITNG